MREKKFVVNWYNRLDVLFEMVKCMVNREVSFLGNDGLKIRNIRANNYSLLMTNFRSFDFFRRKSTNIYISLAKLNGLLMNRDFQYFSFKPSVRAEQSGRFDGTFEDYVSDYDLAIDIDNKGKFDETYDDAKNLKVLFDKYKIPYKIKCSGSGFHFVVDGENIPVCSDIKGKVKFCKLLVDNLKDTFYLKWVDNSIYDMRRIWKCPYSYDWKSGNIALPLTDGQFNKFCFSMVDPENIGNVRDRGELQRKGNPFGIMNLAEKELGMVV